MGEQISYKLVTSRQEFNTVLDNSQTGKVIGGDEKTDKRVRRSVDTERLGRGERSCRIKSTASYIHIMSCFFLTVHLAPHFCFKLL